MCVHCYTVCRSKLFLIVLFVCTNVSVHTPLLKVVVVVVVAVVCLFVCVYTDSAVGVSDRKVL